MRMHAVINAAFPNGITEKIESPGITPLQVSFGKAVTLLLAKVGLDRGAPVMPNQRAWVVNNLAISHEDAPTDIHIIASGPVLRVKHSDRVKNIFPIGHV